MVAHEGYRCKAKTPRGEDNLLLAIYRTNHQVLTMDIQRHETRGERMRGFCRRHLIILPSPYYANDPGG